LHRDFPNFEKATSFVQAQLALCRCTQEQLLQLPPLLLAGPPGIGKTFYAAMLARVLGLPITEVQVSTLSADFSLGGLDASYESAKPGVIWNALQSETMSPLVVLDELDKLPSHAGGALGCLYGLLERHSARRFCDQALLLPVDASWISWMATCNDLEAIEPALRSRFHVIEVQPPTAVQRAAMVSSVHRALLCESSWAGAFDQDLSRAVIARLGDLSPRAVRRTLELAYAKAALAGRRRIEPIDVDAVPGLQRRGIGFVRHP
jgi:ATP-dependent Lon protease